MASSTLARPHRPSCAPRRSATRRASRSRRRCGPARSSAGCDLAWVTGRSQPLVSHHVKVLREAGLVEPRRDGRIVFFALTASGRALLDALLVGEEAGA